MGATTTRARTFICDRCMREPLDGEPVEQGVLFAVPKGWKWGQSPLRHDDPTCYCPECLPYAIAHGAPRTRGGVGCGATWTATPEGMPPVVRFEWATTDGDLTETVYSVRGEPAPVLDLVHRLAL